MIKMELYTIGVYGLTEKEFFEKLITNYIDAFLDIRRRRGVRGSKYAFVNSRRLQDKLKTLGIDYEHIIELSPTNEIRELQKEDDKRNGIQKRDRVQMGDIFRIAYKQKILNEFNLFELISSLKKKGKKRIILFCVEKLPEACHRSLVTDKIEKDYNYSIKHL